MLLISKVSSTIVIKSLHNVSLDFNLRTYNGFSSLPCISHLASFRQNTLIAWKGRPRCLHLKMKRALDSLLLLFSLLIITNTRLDDLSWLQASLSAQNGGLGVRSVGLLAPSAFLASAAATHELQARIAPRVAVMPDPSMERVAVVLQDRHDRDLPFELDITKRACLDQFSINSGLAILNRGFTDDYNKARLLACQAPHSGDWLNAWPITLVAFVWITRPFEWQLVFDWG